MRGKSATAFRPVTLFQISVRRLVDFGGPKVIVLSSSDTVMPMCEADPLAPLLNFYDPV